MINPIFQWPVRIYYEDTDHGGVVYYANYLKYMERARTEYLRACGIEQHILIDVEDIIFAVKRVEADYVAPARFNDLLLVTTEIRENSRVKLLFKQQILVDKDQSNNHSTQFVAGFNANAHKQKNMMLLCDANITIASLSAKKLRPKRVPEKLIEELMCER